MSKYKESVFNIKIKVRDKWIIYNTSTGAMIRLDSKLNQAMCYDEQAKLLVDQGFVIDSVIDEINELEVNRKFGIYNLRPEVIHFSIAPTLQCQARCPYCFEQDIQYKKSMTFLTVQNVVNYIEDVLKSTRAKELRVNFFGGEPLLVKDKILDIGSQLKDYCEKKNIGMHSRLVTNGILLDKDTAELLIRNANIKYVQITLDGMEQTYNKVKGIKAFDTVISNIIAICESVRVIIRLNILPNNREDILKLGRYLLIDCELRNKIEIYLAPVKCDYGCDISEDQCCSEEMFREFETLFLDTYGKYLKNKALLLTRKQRACAFENVVNGCIGPEGEIYQCEKVFGRSEHIIGDVIKGKYRSEQELNFFQDLDEKCKIRKCPLLPICYGGCPMERKSHTSPVNCDALMAKMSAAILRTADRIDANNKGIKV